MKFARLFMVFFFSLLFAQVASANQTVADSPASLTPVSVQVNWNHQFQFAGLYAAVMQGYYAEAGLNVSIKDWEQGIKSVDQVVAGQADFGVGYGTVIIDYAKGAPIKLVMSSFQFSPMVLLSHEPMDSLAAFGGKTIMHYNNLEIQSLINRARIETPQRIQSLPASGDLNDFIEHKVDLYGAYATNEPYTLKQMGIPFYTIDPKTFGVQSYGDLIFTSQKLAIENPQLVQSFKNATIKGWAYAIAHQAEVVDYILAHYKVLKSRDAMLSEAKETVPYIRMGLTPIGYVDSIKLQATAIGAKEVGVLTESQLKQLKTEDFIFRGGEIEFTAEELAFLKQHPVIKLGNDIQWEPFEFIDEHGEFSGLSADYIRALEKKLGVHFVPTKTESWSEVVALAKAKKIDMYSCAVATPERKQYMRFTEPYLSFPMVLAAKNTQKFIDDYSQLTGQTVAVVKGYWSHENLANNYPQINLLVVDSVKEALEAVLEGRAVAYSGNLAVINYAIAKYGLTGLHIAGQMKERFELSMGVQTSELVLFKIIQKGLAAISQEERQTIYNRWIKLEMVSQVDETQLRRIYSIGLMLFLGFMLAIFIYRYQKNRGQAYINQIHELTYATLIDLETLTITSTTDSFSRLCGYSKEELIGMFYPKLGAKAWSVEEQAQLKQLLLAQGRWQGEMAGRRKNGTEYWVDLTLRVNKNFWGKAIDIWATRIDISDKKRVEQLAIRDDLTGLYNRRYFNEVIAQEINRAKRDGKNLAVAMFDIDYFKKINDLYGHQKGDEVLQKVARVIESTFHRAEDYVFRVGGEEFIILSYFEDQAHFRAYLEKLSQEIIQLAIVNEESEYGVLTISVGAGLWQASALEDAEQIYHKVDEMLYKAKQQGRNRIIFC